MKPAQSTLTISVAVAAALAATLFTGCHNASHLTPLPGPVSGERAPNELDVQYYGGNGIGIDGASSSFGGQRASAALRAFADYQEVWIISKPETGLAAREAYPGCGELMTEVERKPVPLPLKHTDVRSSVSGYMGAVQVQQQFENPYDTRIEAVYVFPLPQNAAVNEFIMTVGERRIRGIIRERAEAEKLYREAREQGYAASLLTQERPNIFRQSVANIEPLRRIDVTITYYQTLAYADGWYEFVFPMTVGPRYNPPGSRSGVGPVARNGAGGSGQPVEVPYLKPNERSGHDIALQLDIDAGVPIEEFACATHKLVRRGAEQSNRLSVALDSSDSIPNKDFVFRYRVAGERVKSSLVTHHDDRGSFFSLMLFPPRSLGNLERCPLELVFLLDCSGSMSGKPIEQAKAALRHALHQLAPADSFQIINFSERASRLGRQPLEATPENIRAGLKYVDTLTGDGPTSMIEGIKAALDFPHDPDRLRFVCFMTDGFIGNEAQILGAVHERLRDSRIFSFGVGSSPNRYLLDSLAKVGNGAVAYLGFNDDAVAVMNGFFNRISHPAMTNLKIDWGDMEVSDVFPRRAPDLFVGRPVILTGRFSGHAPGAVRVSGRSAGLPIEFRIPVRDVENSGSAALPSIWARARIADLADQLIHSWNPVLPSRIKQTALDFNLMSPYTAFVAADVTRRTEGSEGVTVPVAVPVPEGVKYSTTVP